MPEDAVRQNDIRPVFPVLEFDPLQVPFVGLEEGILDEPVREEIGMHAAGHRRVVPLTPAGAPETPALRQLDRYTLGARGA